jgi:branched-chain amino acid transport system permease protein
VRWRAARAIEREALEQALEAVGLAGYAAHRVDQLSYADQKLVGLGRALAKGGALLLLDEPLSGLDPAVHERVIGRILEVAKSFAAICIVEHSVATMRMIADEIAFLDAGRLIRQGKPAAILADDELIARYFGSGLDNEEK